ncbi:MAG: metallophosphoesterase [Candidatus Woesearchaeota archaeon]
MKILAFVDMHSSYSSLAAIIKKSAECDMIVCAGDISEFERNIDHLMYKLAALQKQVLIIPGNHESGEGLRQLCKSHENIFYLNGKIFETGNHIFAGIDGNGFAMRDAQFEIKAREVEKSIEKKRTTDSRLVVVTHAAPYKTRLDLLFGKHHGNESVRGFIERLRPNIAVCGHFHENQGKQDKIGNSLIINPGHDGRIVEI